MGNYEQSKDKTMEITIKTGDSRRNPIVAAKKSPTLFIKRAYITLMETLLSILRLLPSLGSLGLVGGVLLDF